MPRYEYKVVPAPTKGLKGKGVRGAEARFSYAVQELMNGLSGYGWEYQRAETLPSTERAGLTGSSTEWRNVLVFRRLRENDADAFTPELLPAPDAVTPGAQTADGSGPMIVAASGAATGNTTAKGSIHTDVEWDNGGIGSDGDADVSGPLAQLAAVRSVTPAETDAEDDDLPEEAKRKTKTAS